MNQMGKCARKLRVFDWLWWLAERIRCRELFADTFCQPGSDDFRQKAEAGSGLTGARSLLRICRWFRKVFSAPPRIWIGGPTSRNRFGAAFVAHLRGQSAHAVFVQQVPQ